MSASKTVFVVGAAMLLLGACVAETVEVPADAVRVESRQVPGLENSNPGLTEKTRAVFGDAASWADFWQVLYSNEAPVPPVPAVDFAREMVVVAGMGWQPTGGYSIRIDQVSANADGVYVEVTEVEPGRGCATTQVVTSPFTAAIVPRRNAPVYWVERPPVASDCN